MRDGILVVWEPSMREVRNADAGRYEVGQR